jgi:hypothetical protein
MPLNLFIYGIKDFCQIYLMYFYRIEASSLYFMQCDSPYYYKLPTANIATE